MYTILLNIFCSEYESINCSKFNIHTTYDQLKKTLHHIQNECDSVSYIVFNI